MESQLVVSSIWEDESLFEISIFGSNGQFSGQADCYTNREEIDLLGKLLEKFLVTQKMSSSSKPFHPPIFHISPFMLSV